MKELVTIYVALIDEAVDAWRPVLAEHVEGHKYRIVEQTHDEAIERWEFVPGDRVECEVVESDDGHILAARRRWR